MSGPNVASSGVWKKCTLAERFLTDIRKICRLVIIFSVFHIFIFFSKENMIKGLFRCRPSVCLGPPNITQGMLGCEGQPFSLAPCCAPRVLHSPLMLKVISPHADKLSVCFGSPNGGAVMGLYWRSLWGWSMCHGDVKLSVCVGGWVDAAR